MSHLVYIQFSQLKRFVEAGSGHSLRVGSQMLDFLRLGTSHEAEKCGPCIAPCPVTQTDSQSRAKHPPLLQRAASHSASHLETPHSKVVLHTKTVRGRLPHIFSYSRHAPFLNHDLSSLFPHFTRPSPFSFDGFRHVFQLHSRLRFNVVVVNSTFTISFH